MSENAFSARQFHHILHCDQQQVSDTASSIVPWSLITSHPMTNSLCVIVSFLPVVSLALPHTITNSMWVITDTGIIFCTSCLISSHHMFWTASEWHSGCHFLSGSLSTSLPMTNSWWVALPIFQPACSWLLTGCEWLLYCPFVQPDCSLISLYQQPVSDTVLYSFCFLIVISRL